MHIEWTQPALADLIEIQQYINEANPQAAQIVGRRVWSATQQLSEHPKIGRDGYVEGTREWVVQKTPCILVYRIQLEQIEILHVHHDRKNWQK